MNKKKSALSTAIATVMGGISMSAQAALTSSASLEFDAGVPFVIGCVSGANFVGGQCTIAGTASTGLEISDMGGSYFRWNNGGIPRIEKTALSMFAPIHLGSTAISSGQHTGVVNGSESPAIDNAFNQFNNTGMHSLSSAVSVISDFGSVKTLDFSGWGINWGNFGPGGPDGGTIPAGTIATITCSTSSCSDTSSYTLDMASHIPQAFPSVPYTLHLEGHISSVPVPAAAWLFGSGIMGLAGVAHRRRDKR